KNAILERRDDRKIPCACPAESHKRFNYLKIYNVLRKPVHPSPNNPNHDDIDFQRSASPRPPPNPIDPSSNLPAETVLTPT
ncbi:hypothetical protein BT96DRAFT_924765, partial [Gymnopus androsaceus JB14]